jgi:hypothetical protein
MLQYYQYFSGHSQTILDPENFLEIFQALAVLLLDLPALLRSERRKVAGAVSVTQALLAWVPCGSFLSLPQLKTFRFQDIRQMKYRNE